MNELVLTDQERKLVTGRLSVIVGMKSSVYDLQEQLSVAQKKLADVMISTNGAVSALIDIHELEGNWGLTPDSTRLVKVD